MPWQVTQQISERTGHLPGVAIAVMGCIVNGVGEMADADFGYVGGAPGKVSTLENTRMSRVVCRVSRVCAACTYGLSLPKRSEVCMSHAVKYQEK